MEEVNVDGLIPVNPATGPDETTSRFSSAIWYEKVKEKDITLAGCGGIGSYVGFLLGRMKPARLVLYDNDTVEVANLSGQLFDGRFIGSYKVDALRTMINEYSYCFTIYTIHERYTQHSGVSPIMICGFDNMEARKVFFKKWEAAALDSTDAGKYLFIDGRLAAEEFQVFAITGDNRAAMRKYEEEYLFSDEEAEETLCSYKQTSYMANMIASVMVNIFTNFCANECGLPFPRETPFLTTYRADYMYFKVER